MPTRGREIISQGRKDVGIEESVRRIMLIITPFPSQQLCGGKKQQPEVNL